MEKTEAELVVRSWRITKANPRGFMMWFDPDVEIPCLRSLPPDSDGYDPFYEGGALLGTFEEEGGVPCEGSDSEETDDDDLPF